MSTSININACVKIDTVDYYRFIGSWEDAFVYNYGHIKIIKPFYMDNTKQLLSPWIVYCYYSSLPQKIKESVSEINIVDYPFPDEKRSFGTEGRVLACCENDKITIYQNGEVDRLLFYKKDMNKEEAILWNVELELQKLIPHEAAHAMDFKNNISSSKEWSIAVQNDYNESKQYYVTYYSSTVKTAIEDFAESVEQYINNPEFKEKFPYRYKFIDDMLKK
jgi:hypothetical protein